MVSTITHSTSDMASLNKIPSVVPLAPLQAVPPQFFITPNYTLATNSSETIPQGIGIAAGAPWPGHAPLRPTPIPCYTSTPPDVFFNGQCIPIPINNRPLPTIHTDNRASATNNAVAGGDLVLLGATPPKDGKRKSPHRSGEEDVPKKIKKEGNSTLCSLRNGDSLVGERDNGRISYPVSALIDMPGGLTRGSRTSSLSSSLSTVRFGGSLSQLWAASLSSLSGKINNMKSTGNIHAEAASLPSLGNQYFAFGGSLPELSLTSLSRLLPNSSTTSSTSSTITATPSTTNLLTVLQPSLYVYPSQTHLATPFINANGSITFGSFLSTGSSLCSTHKPDSPGKDEESSASPREGPCSVTASSPGNSSHGNTSVSLNTLAYVASAQKNLDTEHQQNYKLASVPEHSPLGGVLSPTPSREPIGLECPTSHSLSPMPIDQRVKIEEDTGMGGEEGMGSYSEVKPYFMMMSPMNQSILPCKKEGKEKPYQCDYPGCGRSFSFPAHLKSHVQQIHISYRPCKCDFPGCGKRFYTPQHLNVHRRIHTGERPFVCPYADCNKAFTTAGNLKNHIRTHTGERPYACKFEGCTKRFAEMSSLKKHELTHTGEKPYKCRVCGKAFSQAGSRNTHERKHNRTDGDTKVSRRYRIKRVTTEDDTSGMTSCGSM